MANSVKQNLLLLNFQYKGQPFVQVTPSNDNTDTRKGGFETQGSILVATEKLVFHYLTVVLSNCTYNGNVFVYPISDLEAALRTEFLLISNLEFRGVGCSMVRGDTDSLTLGVAAGYYTSVQKQSLTETEALSLRTAINSAISNVSGFNCSEVRVESTLIQKKTYALPL